MWTWTATAARDVDPGLFPPQGEAGRFCLQALTAADRLGQVFASSTAAFIGAGLVDFVSALGRVGQDQHLVAGDLQEAAADGHSFFGRAFLDADYAWDQRGQQRRVARQNADHTLGARRHHHVDGVFGKDFPLSGDDLDSKGHLCV